MKRILLSAMILVAFGCTVPAERVPLQLLPENGQVLPYADLLRRVRAQANAANDAYYLDNWGDVEDMAKGIKQTAGFMSKAMEVPAKNRELLAEVTGDLAKSADKLKVAAAAKNEKDAGAALQQITVAVRRLRLTD
jgi:hypothetical protein